MTDLKIIVAGGRDFNDYVLLCNTLDDFISSIDMNLKDCITIISGCANGADKLGEQYAISHSHLLKRFPADWSTHGKAAGPIRNREMAKYAANAECDGNRGILIAFWDGISKGTKNMIDTATKYGLEVIVVKYSKED